MHRCALRGSFAPPPYLMHVQASMGAFKNTLQNFLLMLTTPCPLSLNVTGQLKVDSHPCMASQYMTVGAYIQSSHMVGAYIQFESLGWGLIRGEGLFQCCQFEGHGIFREGLSLTRTMALWRSICICHLCQQSTYVVYGCLCLPSIILGLNVKMEQEVKLYQLLLVFIHMTIKV